MDIGGFYQGPVEANSLTPPPHPPIMILLRGLEEAKPP